MGVTGMSTVPGGPAAGDAASGDIADQPLAAAVLKHLRDTRGEDDPLGSLSRAVLSGLSDLRTAANHSWHGLGLLVSLESSLAERDELSPEERAEFAAQAEELREKFGSAVRR